MNDPRLGLPSCSDLPRIVACTGYLQLRAEVGEIPETSSDDAALGNKLHAILKGDGAAPSTLPQRESWIVEQCLSMRNKMRDELLSPAPHHEYFEVRFWIDEQERKLFSGQLDYACHNDDEFLVVNYKTGPIEAEPSDASWQLMGEMIVYAFEQGLVGLKFSKGYGAIVQPLVSTTPTIVCYTAHELEVAKSIILRRLEEAKAPGAPRIPGVQCKFCPLNSRCPEAGSTALIVRDLANKLDTLSPEKIALLYSHKRAIEKVLEDIGDRAKALAAAGQLPGYDLADGYERLTITDIPGFYAAIKEKIPLTREDFFRECSLAHGALKERYLSHLVSNGVTKRDAESSWNEFAGQFGEKKQTASRLVKRKE